MVRRTGVFAFTDRDGIADGYIGYYLDALSKMTERLVIVCGHIPDESAKELLSKYGEVVVAPRKNEGCSRLYARGISHLGKLAAGAYDELILANDSMFGPVYPLEEMFSEMQDKGYDFWSVSKVCATARRSEHIQPYFAVFGRAVLNSKVFETLWFTAHNSESAASEGDFGWRVTNVLSQAGYSWGVYANEIPVDASQPNPILLWAYSLLVDMRAPFVSLDLFRVDMLEIVAGEQPGRILNFIENNTEYDIDLIWEKILRSFFMYDIGKSLGLAAILPKRALNIATSVRGKELTTALIMHSYYPDMFEEARFLASKFPPDTDVYVTTDSEEKKIEIERVFEEFDGRLEVRIVSNRGRSESALIVGAADLPAKYDVLCFWKEKKSSHAGYGTADSWAYKINEGLAASPAYILNVLGEFADKSRLGLLMPAPPSHGGFFPLAGEEWSKNFDNTNDLARMMKLSVPISEHSPPVCPFGGAFWFRGKALEKLFAHGFAYDDFPEEPLELDGTFLHAIERVYPFVCQDAGYYAAYAMTDEYAALEYLNLRHYVRAVNVFKDGYYSYRTYVTELAKHLAFFTFIRKLKNRARRAVLRLPDPIVVFCRGVKRIVLGPNRRHPFRGKVNRGG
jgi:rhamnosyltransferase